MSHSQDNIKQELIGQILNYSSAYDSLKYSLEENYILQPIDFLLYFIEHECTNKTLSAYRCLCLFTDKQLVTINDETKHFLSWVTNDKYAAIYNLSYPGARLPGITNTENINLAEIFQKVWAKLLTHNTYSKYIYLISDTGNVKITHKDLLLLLSSQSMKHFSSFIKDKNILSPAFYLNTDLLGFLEDLSFVEIEDSLFQRCSWLSQVAPLYWDKVARSLYQDFIQRKIDLSTPIFCKCKLDQYIKLFPNLFPQKILDMSNLEYNLRLLSPIIQSYVLGLPIHLYLPGENIIEACIQNLISLGSEEYAKQLSNKNREILRNFTEYSNPYIQEFNITNEKDTMMEDVADYNLFDIVRYWSGKDNHIYYFSRPEYSTLIHKKKNHWNGSVLPSYIFNKLAHRNYLAQRYELPVPDTVLNMLNRLEKGDNIRLVEELINSSESDMSIDYPELSIRPAPPNDDITVTPLGNGIWSINMMVDESDFGSTRIYDNENMYSHDIRTVDILPAPALPPSPSHYFQDLYNTSTTEEEYDEEDDEEEYDEEDDEDYEYEYDLHSSEVQSVD